MLSRITIDSRISNFTSLSVENLGEILPCTLYSDFSLWPCENNYLKSFKWLVMLLLCGMAVSSCAPRISVKWSLPRESPPVQEEETFSTRRPPNPRVLASLQFTDQGRMLLESGRADDAISILERAISLNPTNGQNYYYVSEAWLLKGNTSQAEEFNRLAGIYLEEDAEWMDRVMEQEKRIKKR